MTAAKHAGRTSLLACGAVLLVGTVLALADGRIPARQPAAVASRLIGTLVHGRVTFAVSDRAAASLAATTAIPSRSSSAQWHGFTHPPGQRGSTGSHFAVVGSGRYDAWRVALDALLSHPIGGLGQDNFADYYIRHRHTDEELQWTHSIEFRLLAHTGLVGFALFAVFAGGWM